MGKSSSSSGGTHDPSDNKHEQKLQAVLLADNFSNAFHPVTLEPYAHGTAHGTAHGDGDNESGVKSGKERPLALCPLNNVPLIHHAIDFLSGAGVEELFVLCSSGADALEEHLRRHAGVEGDDRRGSNKTIWSSKLAITLVRDAGCTNAGDALRELDRRNVIKSDPFLLMQGDTRFETACREEKKRRQRDHDGLVAGGGGMGAPERRRP